MLLFTHNTCLIFSFTYWAYFRSFVLLTIYNLMRLFFTIIIIFSLYPSLLFASRRDSVSIKNAEFSENKGQWPEQVLFKTSLGNGNLWLEKNSLQFDLLDVDELNIFTQHKHPNKKKKPLPKSFKRHVYNIDFLNSNKQANCFGIKKLNKYENYIIGNDKKKWTQNVHLFKEVEYQDIYDGVNLHIYEKNNKLKWDFIIKQNINPNTIRLEYKGIDNLKIKNGNLIVYTSVNQITELAPFAYQINGKGDTIEVKCKYHIQGNIVNFILPNSYDKSRQLIIDPTLVFASYTGSSSDNWGFTATYDSDGFLYAGGIVFGGGYPTTIGAYDTTFAGYVDISISKFDTSGSQLIYSTYLGGSYAEVPASLIVNSNNELLILGTTSSPNFPTSSQAYDTTYNGGNSTNISSFLAFQNGSDLFVTHLDNTGSQLIGSTFIGGSNNDGINSSSTLINNYGDDIRGEIMIDKNNNIYIVSTTNSTNYPTTLGVFQPTAVANHEGVISKFDNGLNNLLWSTYFGGNGEDAIYSIKVNKENDIFINGGTTSNNLPTTAGAYQTSFQGGGADGFVARINNSATSIIACSYIGSPSYDQSYLLDIDRHNNVYIFGQTKDTTNIFIYNALWNSPKDGQFITKLNSHLSSRIWSTTFGNGVKGIDIVPSAFMVDLCNRVYLSAWGGAVNNNFAGGNTFNLPITTDALQATTDGSDYYLMVMADDASSLSYGSYYGGSTSHEHVDGGTSRFDNKGHIYQNVCAGCGGHNDFPTTAGCYSSTNNSTNCNNGVFKVDFNIPAIVADYDIPPTICLPDTSYFINTSYLSHPSSTQYIWNFGDGNTSNIKSPNHIYTQGGIYDVSLIIKDPQSCNLSDTIVQQVVILSGTIDTLISKQICPGNSTQIGILPVNDTSIQFNWSPNNSLSNSNISNPFASPNTSIWYTLSMSAGQCSDIYHQYVEVLNLDADAGVDTTVCNNTITLTGNGNYNGLNYVWSSTPTFSDTLNNYPYSNTINYTFTSPTYLYFQIGKLGCYDYDSIFVEQEIIISTGSVQNITCNGDNNGSIAVVVSGGTNPINYNWNNGMNTNPINNLGAGNYSLTVTDANGCSNNYNTTITEPQVLSSQLLVKNIPCDIACIGKTWANPQGGTPPYHWQWNDANSQTTNPAIQLCDGLYDVTITDANNCTLTDSVEVLDSSLYINFIAWADKDTIYKNNSTYIHSTNLNNTYNYSWHPVIYLSNPNSRSTLAAPNTTTTYTVNATDQYGCSFENKITIYVLDVICEEPYIYVPNAFTPNNDGKNDILYVNSSVGYDIVFKIYDRWGELVFETTDINKGWDGTYNNKQLEAGVYVYHLSLECYNNDHFIKKGNITLIR